MTPAHMLLATLAGLGALAAAGQQVRDARAAAWAARVGEALPEAERLREGHAGVRLRIAGEELVARLETRIAPIGGGSTVFEMRVPAPLPRGLVLRAMALRVLQQRDGIRVGVPYLDETFHVMGRDPVWVGSALSDPEVVRGLRWVSQHLGSVGLAGGVLRAVAGWPLAPENLLPAARRVVELGRALADASVSRWAEAGRARGLRLRVSGALAMRLESEDGGVGLRFASRNIEAVGTQVLRVRMRGFPEDVELVARGPEDAPGRPLGDLILDRGLRAAGPTRGLGERLAADAVRGPLLYLLHGAHRPRVVAGCLELRTDGGGAPVLLERLEDVEEVARAVEARWR